MYDDFYCLYELLEMYSALQDQILKNLG